MLHLVHIHKQYLCVSHKPFKLFSLPLNVLVKGFLAVLTTQFFLSFIKIAYLYLLYSRPYNIGAVLLLLGVRTTSFHLISFPSRSLRLKREPKKSFLLWLYNVKKRRSVCTRQEDSNRRMVVRHNL